jgi:hypothetical protein
VAKIRPSRSPRARSNLGLAAGRSTRQELSRQRYSSGLDAPLAPASVASDPDSTPECCCHLQRTSRQHLSRSGLWTAFSRAGARRTMWQTAMVRRTRTRSAWPHRPIDTCGAVALGAFAPDARRSYRRHVRRSQRDEPRLRPIARVIRGTSSAGSRSESRARCRRRCRCRSPSSTSPRRRTDRPV